MVGIDIIEIERVEKSAANPAFFARVFTENEKVYYEKSGKRAETLAGFFSAKEAVVKALGTGFKEARHNEIEINHDSLGAPYVTLYGKAREMLIGFKVNISISHNNSMATAICVLERE